MKAMNDTTFKIGLCKNNEDYKKDILNLFDSKTFRYIQKEIIIYDDYNEVLDEIKEDEFDVDLMLIDIFSDNENGIEVARLINNNHLDTDMIFISSSADNFSYGYTYNAFANLLKPVTRTALESVIKMYLKKLLSETIYLDIHKRNEDVRIPIQDIIYIESNVRKVIVHTHNKDIEYYEKLSALEAALKPYGFIRCHQSFLISYDKITSIGTTTVEMGAFQVPVSRQYKDSLKSLFESQANEKINISDSSNLKAIDAKNEVKHSTTNQETKFEPLSSSEIVKMTYKAPQSRASITGISGPYKGVNINFKSDIEIIIGRDINLSDFIVNLPKVSKIHCKILYNSSLDHYEIIDDSTNGTFINGENRLVKNERYILEPDTTISFGDKSAVFKLG